MPTSCNTYDQNGNKTEILCMYAIVYAQVHIKLTLAAS